MTIEPTRNDEELKAAFQRLETISQAAANTPEADEMEVWVTLIEAYENKHYTIAPPDPIKVIKFRMETAKPQRQRPGKLYRQQAAEYRKFSTTSVR